MNPFLARIKEQILNSQLIEQDKQALLKSLTEADKQWAIADFKLDRTEKVKKTTAILLEETIEELEKKRQAVEAQNRELEIERALEKVRAVAMGMSKSEELVDICEILFNEFRILGFDKVRNAMINIHDDEHSSFVNYDYSDEIGKSITPLVYDIHPLIERQIREIRSADDAFSETVFAGKDLEDWKKFRRERGEKDDPRIDDVNGLHYYFYSIGNGSIGISTFEPIDSEKLEILKRFRNVFILAYQRYTDITKAAAQAREAQIEAALERVRSRTMGMQRSDELLEAANLMFQQIETLGVTSWNCGFNIWDEDRQHATSWNGSKGGFARPFRTVSSEDVFLHFYEAAQRGESLYVEKISGEACMAHYRYMATLPGVGELIKEYEEAGISFPDSQIFNIAYFAQGYLMFITYEPVPQLWDIFKRFAKVFEQTYTRFQDLQRAEAQAREAQIEASLERVRSKTMAMHNSEDVGNTVTTMWDELVHLGIETMRCGIGIMHENEPMEIWTIKPNSVGEKTLIIGRLDMTVHPLLQGVYHAWENKQSSFTYELVGEDLINYYKSINNLPDYPVRIDIDSLPPKQVLTDFCFPEGALFVFTPEPISVEHSQIFKRFAGVFGQTYRRYLDLQKAEAQAREAKIEAALEKVRSRTMAMQRSSELADVATVLFQQVKALGVSQWACGFNIFEIDDKELTWYSGSADGDILPPVKVPLTEHPVFISLNESRKRGDELFIYEKTGEEQADHYRYMMSVPGLRELLQNTLDAGISFPSFQIDHVANFSHGDLLFITYEHVPEMHDVFKRFAKVFDQTYTRFLDLQKAEAQAREAQIESALEKIRSRTMAMQRSDELGDAALLLFQQVKILGGKLFGCGFNIWDEDRKAATAWMAGEDRIQPPFKTSSSEDVFKRIFEAEQHGERLFVEEMFGEVNQTHYRYMLSIPDFKKIVDTFKFQIPEYQVMHCAFFSQGYLMFISFEPVPEAHELFLRFAKVFEQTYTRFLDLQKAEALAKEALKQASLDRIRGQVASMRSADDLEHIIPLLWHELGVLGIPFIRCGVFIMNETDSIVNVYLSSPDGKSLGLLHLPFDTGGVTQNAVEYWRKKKVYKEHWNREEFISWMQTLIAAGQVPDASSYQGAAAPPESLYLHFVPFKQGMLYVGSTEALNHEIIELLKTLASTFSIAYSRYEDFRLLEDAKNRIETTLVELKATQSQLVQSEKMASLGELTAGIAHEIQNPLNFVNNFSELSNELIEEMEEEMKKGNSDEVNNIINDLRSNLEKINQHGRRADSIVKGMLQHSRASTGEKEATDINALADEYLRLAYHGFRAKDKSFNAILETDLDQSIGKIKAVPQELGRVLLNLYNNAFYAVNEKSGVAGYEPKVRLATTKTANSILIAVQDNGKGIPDKVKEKIFQPFFTTKPTGQGTGLGLSLSYDIVKAHGGEFRVDSTEGEGTSFIIQLPM